MNDMTERPEDTIRRLAQEIQELGQWQERYRVAAELWDALELEENDQITEAVLIGKIADFQNGGTTISFGVTEGCDWITQLGLVHGVLQVINANPPTLKPE